MNRLSGASILLGVTPVKPRVLNTQNMARKCYWSMHVLVGWCKFQLSTNASIVYQACSRLCGSKVAKETVNDVSVPTTLCWNFIIVREGFKTVESNWNINKVSNVTAGTCFSHELTQTVGLNILQIWILFRSKFCSMVQVKQY